jgi:hypothetical protein
MDDGCYSGCRGQWWAMHDGNYGIPGVRGNLESVSYGLVWRCVGSNPTLSARLPSLYDYYS